MEEGIVQNFQETTEKYSTSKTLSNENPVNMVVSDKDRVKINLGNIDLHDECGEDSEKLTPEELENIELLQKILRKEEIVKQDFKKEFEKMNAESQKIMSSSMPVHFKEKIMQGLRENLQSKLKSLSQVNQDIKEVIICLEKSKNYSTYINLIHKWKDSNKHSKNVSTTSTNINSVADNSIDNRRGFGVKNLRSSHSFFDNQSVPEEMTEEQRALEDLRYEKLKLEDVVANLKQTRNLFVMDLDNKKDDLEEYDCFVQAKKRVLETKLGEIEELKIKISASSMRKSSNIKHRATGNETERFDRSVSKVSLSTLQDVSTRVSGMFNKVFRKSNTREIHTDKVLSTEFLDELNLQTLPNRCISPKESLSSRIKDFWPSSTKNGRK